MTDPLSALETMAPEETGLVPVVQEPAEATVLKLRRRIAELDAELAARDARLAAQAERIIALEKPGMFGGKAKKRAADLEAENEELRAKVARLEAEAKGGESLLPAVVQAENHLAVVAQENFQLSTALQQTQQEATWARKQLGEMEFERDERDALLRDQEGKAQNAERRQRMAQEQLALVRASAIRENDPAKAQGGDAPKKGTTLTRLRLSAALGNMGSAVELGGDYLDNTCAFCNASPACTRQRLLSWPHGKLVPRHEQEYMKLLVQEAQAHGADPFRVLEAWAGGVGGDEIIDNLTDGEYAKAVEDEAPLVGFAARAAARIDRDVTERSVAHELRALRCAECDCPMLWHADGGIAKRSGDVCALSQASVYERSKLKTVAARITDGEAAGGETIDAEIIDGEAIDAEDVLRDDGDDIQPEITEDE